MNNFYLQLKISLIIFINSDFSQKPVKCANETWVVKVMHQWPLGDPV